jgi:hypothetical protein
MEGLKDDQINSHAAMAISWFIMGNAPVKRSFLDRLERLFFRCIAVCDYVIITLAGLSGISATQKSL